MTSTPQDLDLENEFGDHDVSPNIARASITLPWPPAVNNLYMNVGKRRIRTKRYDAWITEAFIRVLQQSPKRVRGPFRIKLTYDQPDRRRRDLDGLAKAPLDLLVKTGVIDDDSLAQSLSLAWSDRPPAKPGFVTIELEAA